jgi:hypothetical protein
VVIQLSYGQTMNGSLHEHCNLRVVETCFTLTCERHKGFGSFMFAMYSSAVMVAMLGKALHYLGLHAVLLLETMVISLPNAIHSRRSR